MNKEEKDSNIVKELFEGAHHAIITLSNGNKIAVSYLWNKSHSIFQIVGWMKFQKHFMVLN